MVMMAADEFDADFEEESVTPSALSVSLPSVPVMTGTHFHSLDEKGRIIIPAKLRPALTEQFWMILDENDNVGIYNYQTGLDVLEHCERMVADHPEDDYIAGAVELITGAADLVTVENGYRVPVSEVLRYHAELSKEVVTVGVLNHAIVWSREKWEKAQTQRGQSPEVRRAQAMMLRAAASSVRRRAEPVQAPAEIEIEHHEVAALATGTGGDLNRGEVRSARRSANPVERAATASAGDGGRSARVLALSKLGR
jgi:MraZ protein